MAEKKKTVKAQSSKKSVKSKKKPSIKEKKTEVTKPERLLTAEGWKRKRIKEMGTKKKAKK